MKSTEKDLPSQWIRYKPLLDRCTNAELTSAVLTEKNGVFRNVFSVLTFTRQVGAGPAVPSFEYLTKRPEGVPRTDFRLGIARSVVSALDGCGALPTSNKFVEPVNGCTVECQGSWADPLFVGHESHRLRHVVPHVDAQFWVFQHVPPVDVLTGLMGKTALGWILEQVSTVLGRPISARTEYAGSFLVVLPEYRGGIRVERAENGRLGIEFEGDRQAIQPAALARVSRHEEMCSAALVELNERLTVMEVGASDFEEVELYDLKSGLIIDRHAGIPARGFAATILTGEPIAFDVTLHDEANAPVGAPINVATTWGWSVQAGVEERAEWERAQRRSAVLAEQKRLHGEGRLFFYSGDRGDRAKAMLDIRRLIRTHSSGELFVWDKYFGGRDAVEFLPHVGNPATPIRVLTSLARAEDSPKREGIEAQLRDALAALAIARGRGPGMTNIQVRLGYGFHDRFLITDLSCWQLGCSFNQIGCCYSTIVEFPYRDLVVRAFEKEWAKGSPFELP